MALIDSVYMINQRIEGVIEGHRAAVTPTTTHQDIVGENLYLTRHGAPRKNALQLPHSMKS